jgi:hypothetical protein
MRRPAGRTLRSGNRWAIAILSAAAAVTNVAPGRAQGLVEFEFAGVVTDDTGNLGVFGSPPTTAINDPFSGRFSYTMGPGNPDQAPGDPKIGQYSLVAFELDQAVVAISPASIVVQHDPGLPQLDPMAPPAGFDRFGVVGTFSDGVTNRSVVLRLEAPYGAAFADDSLPANLSLSIFTDQSNVQAIRVIGLMGGSSQIDAGQLTSLVQVPEPSVSCLAYGLAALLTVNRARCRPGRCRHFLLG